MRVLLMYRDRDFDQDQLLRGVMYQYKRDPDRQQQLSTCEQALIQDLELDTLLHAMAGDNEFLYEVARKAVLSGLQEDMDTIMYRQQVLKDCLNNTTAVRDLYDVTVDAIEQTKKRWWDLSSKFPSSLQHSAIDMLEVLL